VLGAAIAQARWLLLGLIAALAAWRDGDGAKNIPGATLRVRLRTAGTLLAGEALPAFTKAALARRAGAAWGGRSQGNIAFRYGAWRALTRHPRTACAPHLCGSIRCLPLLPHAPRFLASRRRVARVVSGCASFITGRSGMNKPCCEEEPQRQELDALLHYAFHTSACTLGLRCSLCHESMGPPLVASGRLADGKEEEGR